MTSDEDKKKRRAEYMKQYRQTDKHKDIRKVSHKCECGGKFKIHNKYMHEKSKKHIKWMTTK